MVSVQGLKILYVNPNSTHAMTDSVVAVAKNVLPEAHIIGWTNLSGPPAIQGEADGKAAVAGVLDLLPAAAAEGFDCLVIACFDDTGLNEIRTLAHCPVLGIGQAAYHMAVLSGRRFSVVTTLPVSVPVLEGNIRHYGFLGSCVSVRASGLAVLEVENGGTNIETRLKSELEAASAEGADVVVLGCAGMARFRRPLQVSTGLNVIDGVEASATLATALCRQRSLSG